MKNFLLRTFTGVAYVAIISAGILLSSRLFLLLFSLVSFLCLWEFYGLVNNGKQASVNRITNSLGGVLLFASTYFYASKEVGGIVFLPYLCYIVFVLVSELYRKKENPLIHLAYTFMGQFYVALPVSILNLIAFQPDFSGLTQTSLPFFEERSVYFPLLIFSLFVFIWINDTGAYLVGVTCGKHRLFPRISPKKSWEGFFGGLVLTVASSFLFAKIEPLIPYYHWIGLSAVVVVFGTWGDLIESLMKRTLCVKDSGSSLPGHGGFLDRFDSLLMAVYGMLFYIEIFIRN